VWGEGTKPPGIDCGYSGILGGRVGGLDGGSQPGKGDPGCGLGGRGGDVRDLCLGIGTGETAELALGGKGDMECIW
jgi:hypothetical protein